jgi:GH24 family phage-related lysozyme (muramidase)
MIPGFNFGKSNFINDFVKLINQRSCKIIVSHYGFLQTVKETESRSGKVSRRVKEMNKTKKWFATLPCSMLLGCR